MNVLVITQEPLKDIIEKLSKILDVTPADEKDTIIFKESNVSHKKLCTAFEYWIDQSKMIFREPVLVGQNQSLRDAGVDLSMRFMISELNIGFQIKSYGDVKEKEFSTKVNAQITQSHRHNLKKLILAVAGNLNDSSQAEKIRGLFSEIRQQNDDYVIIVPPEKVVTIYNTFVAKDHPLKSVLLDLSDLMKFTGVLQSNLSNEKRTVKIDVKVEYTTPPTEKKSKHASFTLKLKNSEL